MRLTMSVMALLVAACGTKPEPAQLGVPTGACWSQIKNLLDQSCVSCHGPTTASAGVRLDSLAAAQANAERANARIQAGTMPPAGPLADADKQDFASWLASGLPQDCAGGQDGQPQVTCSTGRYWSPREDDEGPLMRPGSDCMSCHDGSDEAPRFVTAGTVMGAYHDANLCVGIAGAIVQIVAGGGTTSLATNSSGNFYRYASQGAIAVPYSASVMFQGHANPMTAAQGNLNCMSCHTRDGSNGAPGRISIQR